MRPDVFILDFEDSFTYNIASEMEKVGFCTEVIGFSAIKDFLARVSRSNEYRRVLVYGPGPGSPDDYRDLCPLIRPLLQDKNIFHLGICLGHQLLWAAKENIRSIASKRPMHGQKA